MAERRRKVVLIGAKGYERADDSLCVDCLPWTNIRKLQNIRDYDVVILNLLSLTSKQSREEVDWAAFVTLLDFHSTMDILMNGGMIIVIGDPRFPITATPSDPKAKKEKLKEKEGVDAAQAFLAWTGVKFAWDSEPGDTVLFADDYDHRRYADYIGKLKKWEYSLAGCRLDDDIVASRFNLTYLREHGSEFHLEEDDFCCNRYKHALAVRLHYQYRDRQYKTVHRSFGPVVLLPKVNLSEDETLQLVLTSICGIETNLPEPEWLSEFVAPGQKAVDDDITRIRSEIKNMVESLQQAEGEKSECRKCLKLLYEREFALEPVVRDILRGFGAHVEDPTVKNKEDGWLVVEVAGTTLEGVLEIKSTKADTFSEDGRKQLLDWIDRGRTLRDKNYKGIFIGNSAVDKPWKERPWAFPDNWVKAATLSGICALKTEDLYVVHLLKSKGLVDLDGFWQEVFQTNGVFGMKKYWELLSPGAKSTA